MLVIRRIWLLSVLLLLATQVQAGNLFTEVSYLEADVSVGGQTYKPTLSKLAIGWQFTDRFSAELHSSFSSSEDQVGTISAEITRLQAIMLRYGTPITGHAHFYLAAGASDFDLAVNGTVTQSDQTYGDSVWGFGLQEHLESAKNLWVSFEYLEYYRNEDLVITSYSLGLRYDF